MSTAGTPTRPGTVTAVVVITFIQAIIGIAAGIGLLLASDNLLNEAGITKGTATTLGWTAIILGVITALVAWALNSGSNLMRMLVSVIMAVHAIFAVYTLIAIKSTSVSTAVVQLVVSIVVLALLWNHHANEYFEKR